MGQSKQSSSYERFQKYYFFDRTSGFGLDISRMGFSDEALEGLSPKFTNAFKQMSELVTGVIANPDENRMVGHYWLRNPTLAPNATIRGQIEDTLKNIKQFASDIHAGKIQAKGKAFKQFVVIGIGGSALGPQLAAAALGRDKEDKLTPYFIDNTDPDGIHRAFKKINALEQTLVLVVSKSGGTKETRNGMLEAEAIFKAAHLDFAAHAIAVTGEGSELDKHAKANKWLAIFPMWDWVGGRTSELSAVGLLPAALQGINIDEFVKGAAYMDGLTGVAKLRENPAALLAAAWFITGKGKGLKDMVVLPYKDRFELFSRYLQQLVMESLGKERNLRGEVVNQGIAVYGNKGSTDQHAYVQQLREGLNNFFVTFIEVLKDNTFGTNAPLMVEPNTTSGDYLSGFLLGTRQALSENGRESLTLTVREVSPFTLGMLIALFERAVGLYASLIEVNAYHQPGVEAGKKAATVVLTVQQKILNTLKESKEPHSVESLTAALGETGKEETVFKILQHLALNARVKVVPGTNVFTDQYLAL
jgi:glucose-6-phosphate isomerase